MIDAVPGVAQKLLLRRVPQLANSLQLPLHPLWSQNPTFAVALKHAVPGVLKHVAPPLYTVQLPPHTLLVRFVQYVTITLARLVRLEDAEELVSMGSPT